MFFCKFAAFFRAPFYKNTSGGCFCSFRMVRSCLDCFKSVRVKSCKYLEFQQPESIKKEQYSWSIHNPQLIENWSTGNVRRFTNTVVLVFQMLFINKLLFSLYSLMSGINQKLLPPGIKGLKQYNIVTHFIFISVLIFKIFCVFNMRKMISKHNNLYKEDLILYVINQLLKFVLRYAS